MSLFEATDRPVHGEPDYALIFNASSNGMAFTEFGTGKIIDVNNTWIDATGIARGDAVGKTAYELGLWVSWEEREACVAELTLRGQVSDFEAQLFMRAERRPHLISGRVVNIGSSRFVLWEFRDVSRRQAVERELQRQHVFLQKIIDSVPGVFYVFDKGGRFLMWNRNLETVLERTAEDVAAAHPLDFFGASDKGAVDSAIRQVFTDGETMVEARFLTKNGQMIPFLFNGFRLDLDTGPVAIGMGLDISERKLAEEKVQELAFFDPLTGLPNRTLLTDRLKQAMIINSRSGNFAALMFIDLDHFKTINDTLGHDMGDLLLKQVAQRLTTCVRGEDTVARLGGDEFLLMLQGLSEDQAEAATQVELVGGKILRALNQPYQINNAPYHCSPSIGATLFDGQTVPIKTLLKQADLAMYKSKAAGRNTIRFFDPEMESAVLARAAMESGLYEALENDQFVLYYQPQVDGRGRVTGAEVLIRWQHPERGMVPPGEFIPLAEETGVILPLGHWVLTTACDRLTQWATQPGMAGLTVAVNVSARQFLQPDFVAWAQAVIKSTNANPLRLKLELTESLLVENVADIIEKMTALKAHGVGFSLDDFGTGYSSLSYLKRLPLDQLKIDQSFVRDVLTDSNDAAIARTVVALAHNLDLSVIAEGVETLEQRDFLAGSGCHAYQGYLFSRPLPVDLFERFVRQANA